MCTKPIVAGILGLSLSAWAQTDMIVYDDALQNGWANWGWADINYNQGSVVHSGSKAVSVVMGAWEAVYIFHGAMDSRYYTDLTFWIHGGSTGGQQLQVVAMLNGVAQPGVDLPALVAGTWQQVTIPLADLGVDDEVDFSELQIRDRVGSAQPVFYFDDMRLVGAPPVTNLPVSITVDAMQNRHPINPLIYGVNFADTAELAELNATLNRSGGNAESRYNWQLNAHNRAADWYFLSGASGPDVPGESTDSHIQASKNGGAEPFVTIPMMGWVPKLGPNRSSTWSYSVAKYGAQTGVEPWNSDMGNGVRASDGALITWNDPTDANYATDATFQQDWIEHLTNTWGISTNGGVRYYCLDNEYSLWDNTHRDIHPSEATTEEVWGLLQEYGQMVKSVDPGARLIFPEDGADYAYPDRDTYGGGQDFIPWLLDQSSQFEATHGYRLLDMLSVHYYPPDFHGDTSVFAQRQRNRSTRALWDPDFVDSSYARKTDRLVPTLRDWVDAHYPGTPAGITEYNWGAEDHINGATAQADVWGIFGREGLGFATRWTTPAAGSMVFNAMKMYRNYDNNDSMFGDTSVSATGSVTEDDVATYAAVRSADNTLTLMVINKHLTATAQVSIALTNFPALNPVEVWQLTSSNVIQRLGDLQISGSSLNTDLPPQSITLFVASGAEPPVLRDPQMVSGNRFGFWVDSQAGRQIEIQGSSNLIDWLPVQTNMVPEGDSVQVDVPATSASRFFRALLQLP